MTYKKLIMAIHHMTSEAAFDGVLADIDKSFEGGKINFDDHEMLYDLACWVWKGKRDGSYVRSV